MLDDTTAPMRAAPSVPNSSSSSDTAEARAVLRRAAEYSLPGHLTLGLTVDAMRDHVDSLPKENPVVVPIERQVSAGLEVIQSLPIDATADVEVVKAAVAALKAELDDPPDRFRDPISFSMMDEPMVISSGHTFDKTTVYDDRGRLRFDTCPLTREVIERKAYPLHYLKREIVDFKLRRLDGILKAAERCEPASCKEFLLLAKALLDSLGSERYQERAATYWRLRFATCEDTIKGVVGTLAELTDDLACAARDASSRMIVSQLIEAKSLELIRRINDPATIDRIHDPAIRRYYWVEAAENMAFAIVGLPVLASRPSWLAGWVAAAGQILSKGSGRAAELPPAVHKDAMTFRQMANLQADPDAAEIIRGKLHAGLRALQPSQAVSVPAVASEKTAATEALVLEYWTLCLEVAPSDASTLQTLQSLARHVRPERRVLSIIASGAGAAAANGTYVLEGEYQGAPLYKNGSWWMLRYTMPSALPASAACQLCLPALPASTACQHWVPALGPAPSDSGATPLTFATGPSQLAPAPSFGPRCAAGLSVRGPPRRPRGSSAATGRWAQVLVHRGQPSALRG